MFKPNNWDELSFNQFFESVGAKKYQIQKQDYLEEGSIPVVDQGQKKIAGFTENNDKILDVGDGVIVFGDHTRIVKYIDFNFAVGADGTQILKTKEGINLKFAYYQLLNKQIPNMGYSRHFKFVKEKKYYLPKKIEEQEEIVKVLDDAADMVRLRKECIDHTEDLTPAIFYQMFGDPSSNEKGWQTCSFKDVAKIDRKNISASDIQGNTYSYIGLEHIEKDTGKILVNSEETQNIEIKSNKFYFTNEHILYGKLRPYLNKVALPEFNGVCSTDIFPILPKYENKISNRFFVKYLMSSKYFVNSANSLTAGANLPRIGTAALEQIKVFKPDFDLQEEFAKIAKEIEDYKKQQYQELKYAEDLFQSLLQKAFTGELTSKVYGG